MTAIEFQASLELGRRCEWPGRVHHEHDELVGETDEHLAGDSLGWLYSVEWPVFACFGVYFWWFWIHDDPSDLGRRKLLKLKASGQYHEVVEPAQVRAEELEDAELRAYNDYLATLAAARDEKSFRLRKSNR